MFHSTLGADTLQAARIVNNLKYFVKDIKSLYLQSPSRVVISMFFTWTLTKIGIFKHLGS